MVALGRRVEHDPLSRQFPARRATQPRSVLWTHNAPVLDQGELGSCTGNALAQCLNTAKFAKSRPRRRYLDERAAVDLYSVATALDEFDGTYPPIDTGSSGLGVAKAGVRMGYLASYTHAFGFSHFADALALQPVIVGPNWYTDMFEPSRAGVVRPAGQYAGGHEYLAIGINYRNQLITFLNSWGDGWGDGGRFRMTFHDFGDLLDEDGDVTVPIR